MVISKDFIFCSVCRSFVKPCVWLCTVPELSQIIELVCWPFFIFFWNSVPSQSSPSHPHSMSILHAFHSQQHFYLVPTSAHLTARHKYNFYFNLKMSTIHSWTLSFYFPFSLQSHLLLPYFTFVSTFASTFYFKSIITIISETAAKHTSTAFAK